MSAPATDLLRAAIRALKEAGIEAPALDARLLLAHALEITPDRLIARLGDPLDPQAEARFAAAITARSQRQPVSQITGQRMFWGLPFRVTRDTLDPRPDTEAVVAEALTVPFSRMLDLGTGTGCILLACLDGMPSAAGTGLDLSEAALAVARDNAARLGLSDRSDFLQSDWFAALPAGARFDLITSNPPYIAEDEMPGLAPEVHDWEPHLALTPGGDGLSPYRLITARAVDHLLPGGRLLLEIGASQAAAVAAMAAAQGFEDIRILPDLDQRDRVVAARRPG